MTPTTLTERLITAEEFSRMPDPSDGSQQELVRGVIISMPPPSFARGECCARIARVLGNHVYPRRLGRVVSNDAGVVTESEPDSVRGPDVVFYSTARLPTPPTGLYPKVVPDLVVEVLSPSNRPGAMREKVREYLASGAHTVWLVSPGDCTVNVYRTPDRGEFIHSGANLTAKDLLPGLSVPVADLFDTPPTT